MEFIARCKRKKVALAMCKPKTAPCISHTPSIAFRHLPPGRKDVVNQCLEFVHFDELYMMVCFMGLEMELL